MIRKFAGTVLVLATLFFSWECQALTVQVIPGANDKKTKLHITTIKDQLMFVAVLGGSKFKQLSGIEYQLTASESQIKSILAFNATAHTAAFKISPKELFQQGDNMKGTRLKIRPNLAIAFGKTDAAFELVSYAFKDHQLTLVLKRLGDASVPSVYSGKMALFIDVCPCIEEVMLETGETEIEVIIDWTAESAALIVGA